MMYFVYVKLLDLNIFFSSFFSGLLGLGILFLKSRIKLISKLGPTVIRSKAWIIFLFAVSVKMKTDVQMVVIEA